MAAGMQYRGPMYISAHSADVILSDIRPVKFKLDALHALNAILDEILCSIVTAAHSLSTTRLKAGLLRILPTPLGKEALLEAELELRAYWERTNSSHSPSASLNASLDNGFNLKWAVELMQLKCQAYSTLNDADEDAHAETKLNERMGQSEVTPAAVVAPAALYLTAILECICEHILTNVGRVATRDSSRTAAGVQDLFTALCEDGSMYALFRRMNVYDQVEGLSRPQKPKRSKSFTRQNERSTEPSPTPPKDTLGRLSSESTTSTAIPTGPSPAPRSSLEKVKAIKLFNKAHGRSSSDREVDVSAVPRKADGSGYEGFRKAGSISGHSDTHLDPEDDERDQEFEDLMRSAGTMKMSLTPDRLRTMESPKAGRAVRQTPNAPEQKDENNIAPALSLPRTLNTRRPSVHHVDSIKEDEEPKDPNVPPSSFSPTQRTQDLTPPASAPARLRSISTSGGVRGMGFHTSNKSLGNSPSLSSMRDTRGTPKMDEFGMPKRTRKVQRNRESIDLDDVMNGFDEEAPPTPAKPTTPGGRKPATGVSQSARDLIAFLDDGPPLEPLPQRNGSISVVSLTPTSKSGKGGGRLQRMISKLSLGGSDKDMDSPKRKTSHMGYSAPNTPSLSSNKSFSRFQSPTLPTASLPIPPRIPSVFTISPPASPLYETTMTMDDVIPYSEHTPNGSDRHRKPSIIRKAVPAFSPPAAVVRENHNLTPRNPASPSPSPSPTPSSTPASPAPSPQPQSRIYGRVNGAEHAATKSVSKFETNGVALADNGRPPRQDRVNTLVTAADPRMSRRSNSPSSDTGSKRVGGRKSVTPSPSTDPAPVPAPPSISQALALDMHRMLTKASTADECRLLVDMFMAKAGVGTQSVATATPPSPPPSPAAHNELEETVIELLLGGGNVSLSPDDGEPRRSYRASPRQSQEEQGIKTPSAAAAAASHTISSPDTPTPAQTSTPAVQNHIPPSIVIKA
ncbi:hypothetical protein OF83DRAFT_1105910 [Amylostereum chailletii]|nr:hypothetical protein OF83DRAFT_1105910 [Amylostereum chailletii]